MSIRHIPFGYKMIKGEIVINEPEVEAVRRIFSLYLQGASLREIAGEMTVPYIEGAAWDKHKVKRVLDHPRYLGTECYPKLIDEETYIAVNCLKTEKNTSTLLPCADDLQPLREAAYCGDCGGWFLRKPNYHGKVCWRCFNSHCENRTKLSDDALKNSVVTILNYLIENPQIIHISQSLRPMPIAVTKLQNEINREMSKAKPDVSETQKLILALAAEKYASCTDTQADLAFRTLFENHEPASHFDRGLFDSTVDKVFISATGAVFLRLKNGQILPEP